MVNKLTKFLKTVMTEIVKKKYFFWSIFLTLFTMMVIWNNLRPVQKLVLITGSIRIQFCRLLNVIWLDFGQVESRLSQTLSEKIKTCYNEGSNSRS